MGRQVSQTWPNGLSETRTYDSASRLLAITPGQQDKKGAPTITYTYDQRGNRLTMDRSDVGLSSYTYDEISQLLTAALPDGDFQTYTFDAVGNRLSLQDSRGLQAYSYDEADELLEVESDFNPEEPAMKGSLLARLGASDANKPLFKTVYGWDADGNQISKTGPGNKMSRYDFDAMDRLAGVSAPGSEPEQYLYNADRQRIATVHGKEAVAERFLHLGRGRQVLADLDGSGRLTKRYILLPSGQLLAHVDSSANKPAFYHFDALGSTMILSDSANRITARFVYDPYGLRRSTPETDEGYGFVGEEGVVYNSMDLHQMGNRWYSSTLGRFIARDPMWQWGGDGNGYVYALNNPLGNIDPLGLTTWPTDTNAATSTYGTRQTPRGQEEHTAVDIPTEDGNIYATDGGTVVSAGYTTDGIAYVRVREANGEYSTYYHVISDYAEGSSVREGARIGVYQTDSPNSGGPHVHYTRQTQGSRDSRYDPMPHLKPGPFRRALNWLSGLLGCG